jgi:tight adherence protein B
MSMFVIFGGIMIFSFAMVAIFLKPGKTEKIMEKRLKVISASSREQAEEEKVELMTRTPQGAGGLSNKLGSYLERFDFSEDLQLLILYAGSRSTVGSVVFGSVMAACAAGFMAHAFLGILPLDLLAVLLGGSARYFLLTVQKGRRLKKFDVGLPDSIELMARALRAGHSMASAIEVMAEQSPEPLGSEFAVVFQQQKFGIPFRDAILQLGERVPSKDLHFLITAILVQKETGGDLTEILDRTTYVIRDRVRIQGEIKTYTAQGRMTGWILGTLPVALLVIINVLTPGYSTLLFHDPVGQSLLYAGGAMLVVGGLIIRKIVNIEV